MKISDLDHTIENWIDRLKDEEKSKNTISQYVHSLNRFIDFIKTNEIDEIKKEHVIAYKNSMLEEMERNLSAPEPGRRQLKSIRTINLRLIALNKFFRDSEHEHLTVKLRKEETSNTLDDVLSEKEYERILKWADQLGNKRAKLIMKTLAGTGIRIGELKAITVEALKSRKTVVTNKGKTRTIFIPKKLTKELKAYCKEEGIKHGIIFHGRDKTKPLNVTSINAEMKEIAGKARGIKRDKIHAHAFRHFFAKRYAEMPGANVSILPMLLGHSDKTQGVTSLYVKPTKKELLKAVDDLEAYYTPNERKKRKK